MLRGVKISSDFEGWVGDRPIETLGNNISSKNLPFQSWRPFKEAFAPEIVQRAIEETPGRVTRLLDPFGGSGTSALTAQFLGAFPTTIEVNPFLADLIESKLFPYSIAEVTRDYAAVMNKLHARSVGRPNELRDLPATFVEPGKNGKYIFSKPVARRLAKLIAAIEASCSAASARLFRVIAGAIAVDVSNVVVSGKGRRYRRNWQSRVPSPSSVDLLFRERMLGAISDISRYGRRREDRYALLRGDARVLLPSVGEQDVAVFSPPYPNSFDYTDVYNVELWLLGYFRNGESNRSLRGKTLRSHVQIKRSYAVSLDMPQSLKSTYSELVKHREALWSRYIPEMVVSYFDDMANVLKGVSKPLRKRGRIYCVVGDSQYAGVAIPVAKILKQLVCSTALKLVYSEQFRSMRVSPQQGGREELPETLLVFEKG